MTSMTDKVFWHHYDDFYLPIFQSLRTTPSKICEIGVFRGDSLRWLQDQFPEAHIFAADILPIQENWPISNNIKYFQFDQANKLHLQDFFAVAKPDLIIEDGSHHPEHQALSLILGIKSLTNRENGGLYLLEDVHTNHPNYPFSGYRKRVRFMKQRNQSRQGNSLSLLLALEHLKSLGREITLESATELSKGSIFSSEDIMMLSSKIKKIILFRRNRLPSWCHRCGSSDFNYHEFICKCNEEIFRDSDSMSFALFV